MPHFKPAMARLKWRELKPLRLCLLPLRLAVCRLDPAAPVPAWLPALPFWSVTRTDEELSVVVGDENVPADWRAERGWRCLKVQGPLEFGLTGILASLASQLAEAGIPIFVISTYDTDYLLMRDVDLSKGIEVLSMCGHLIEG